MAGSTEGNETTSLLKIALHHNGVAELQKRPDWDLCDIVERFYRKNGTRIAKRALEMRKDWMKHNEEGGMPGSNRPGGLVAKRLSEEFASKGLYIYATHPSQDDNSESDEYTGPRWYVCIMESLISYYREGGCVPYPPPDLEAVIWPRQQDKLRPWITEAGWTMVPAGSDPQVLHADICGWGDPVPDVRERSFGRYHHLAWKQDGRSCTTNVVKGGFSEGSATWDDYARKSQVKGPAVVIDSECLHCGGPTKHTDEMSFTLTVQLCSGAGWSPLHTGHRVSAELLGYTHPIGWEVGAAVECLNGNDWERGTVIARADDGDYVVRTEGGDRILELTDTDLRYRSSRKRAADVEETFELGQKVLAKFQGEWFPAKVRQTNPDGTFRVIWEDGTFSDGLSSSYLRYPGGAVRGEQPAGPESKRPAKRARVVISLSPMLAGKARPVAVRVLSPSARAHLLVRDQGFFRIDGKIPAEWRDWQVLKWIEVMYEKYGHMVQEALSNARASWPPRPDYSERWGSVSATEVSVKLAKHGISVYSPPECLSNKSPYPRTGPRWYVSLTTAAKWKYGGDVLPPLPPALHELLDGPGQRKMFLRGLGWTAAPPNSDPQALHADLWTARRSGVKWPHLLWKTDGGTVTTQVMPQGFTQGRTDGVYDRALETMGVPAAIVDAECLHRGAATGKSWGSAFSVEFCTSEGKKAWDDYESDGTTKPTEKEDPAGDWNLLSVALPDEWSEEGREKSNQG